jgi:ribonuclease III
VVGAIYLDSGFDACRSRVLPWFEPLLARLPVGGTAKDAKTRLQEWLQARQLPLPEYRLLAAEGEDHEKTFHVLCVRVSPGLELDGRGTSRRQAEQNAAHAVMTHLEDPNERD